MAAEETPGIQNKGLLVVAAVLGLVVVVIYNIHIQDVRKAGRGKTVALLQYARDLEGGETLTRKDIELVRVPKESAQPLGNVVDEDNKDYAVGSKINQDVQKGQWVLWGHVTAGRPRRPLQPKKGWVAVSVEVDPKTVPGELVWVGSRVNIVAMLPVRGQPPSAKRVIEAVRVLAVGGRTYTNESGSRKQRPATSYRAITIEVKKDVSLKLQNVLSHKSGNIRLELRNPDDSLPPGAEEISPELESLTRSSYQKPLSRP